jgi:TPR repeat protein
VCSWNPKTAKWQDECQLKKIMAGTQERVGRVSNIRIIAKKGERSDYGGGSGGSANSNKTQASGISSSGEWGGSLMSTAQRPKNEKSMSGMDEQTKRAMALSVGSGGMAKGSDDAMIKAMEQSKQAQEEEEELLRQVMAQSSAVDESLVDLSPLEDDDGNTNCSPKKMLAELDHAPALTASKPEDVSGIKGNVIELLAVAYIGTKPLKYEWFRNGEPVHPQRDHASFQINLNEDYAGVYFCRVSNAFGAVESRKATVKIVSMLEAMKQKSGKGDKKKKKKKNGRESRVSMKKEAGEAFVWGDPLGDLPATISLATDADGVAITGPDGETLKVFSWDDIESFEHKAHPELCDAFSFSVTSVGTYKFECDSFEPFDAAFRAGKDGKAPKSPAAKIRSLQIVSQETPQMAGSTRICNLCQFEFFSASGKSVTCMDCRQQTESSNLQHQPTCDACGHEFFSASGRSTTCVDCRKSKLTTGSGRAQPRGSTASANMRSRGSTAASLAGLQTDTRNRAEELYEEGEGWYCGCGKGVDEARAAEMFGEAADLGWAPAAAALATCYGRGRGIKEDHGEARRWYARSHEMGLGDMAQGGSRSAQYWYGYASKDRKQAIRWQTSAAELGHSNAQHSLAMAYAGGLAVKKDKDLAAFWYEKAAKQGNLRAQYSIGKVYMEGKGMKQDFEEAASWLEKATLQGHSQSEALLYKVRGWQADKAKKEQVQVEERAKKEAAKKDLEAKMEAAQKEKEEKEAAQKELLQMANLGRQVAQKEAAEKEAAEKARAQEAAEEKARAQKEAEEMVKAQKEAEEKAKAQKEAEEKAMQEAEKLKADKMEAEKAKNEAEAQAVKLVAPAPLTSQLSEMEELKLEIDRLKMENMRAELARLKAESVALAAPATPPAAISAAKTADMCSVCGKAIDHHTDAELDRCIDEEERLEAGPVDF